jgi:hypothetical protein
LQINPQSGVLFGIPPIIKDLNDTNATVAVMVTDEDGLSNIKSFTLRIKDVNSAPSFAVAPIMNCFVSGDTVNEKLVVSDRDLVRTGGTLEQLTITVVKPAGLTVTPPTINGGIDSSAVTVNLVHTGAGLTYSQSDLVNGRLQVIIRVTDRAGLSDELEFYIRVSDPVTFLSDLHITNSLNHTQKLEWGTAPGATTGLGNDGNPAGLLDERYCEIEVPPLPPTDVFDARWTITTGIAGVYRNVYPTATAQTGNNNINYRYIGTFQAGGENSASGALYPVTIRWNPLSVPAKNDNVKNPTGSTWRIIDDVSNGNYFSVDMRDTDNKSISSAITWTQISSELVEIKIHQTAVQGFAIIHDWYSDVEEIDDNFTNSIVGVSPNPITTQTEEARVAFEVNKSGNVYIELFDVLGNKVSDIADGYFTAGSHNVKFNLRDFKGSKLSSGAYTVRMSTGMEVKTFRLIVSQ